MGESVAERPETRDHAVVEHLVCFTDGGGSPQRERHVSLGAAVSRVEQLANDHGVDETEVFALHPVRLARRQRWHVAVEVGPSASALDAPHEVAPHEAAPSAAAQSVASPSAVAAVPDAADLDVLDVLDVEVVEQSYSPAATTPEIPLPPTAAPEPLAAVSAAVSATVSAEVDPGLLSDAAHDANHDAPHDVLPSAPRGRGLGFFVH